MLDTTMKVFAAVFAAIVCMAAQTLCAADQYWVGGASGDWGGDNWAATSGGTGGAWTDGNNANFDTGASAGAAVAGNVSAGILRGITDTAITPAPDTLCGKSYKYYRFVIDSIRSGNDIQVSRIDLYDMSGSRLVKGTHFTVTASSGVGGNSGETYVNVADGNTSTKWCQKNITNLAPGYYIQFTMTSPVRLSKYTWYTANDTANSKGRNLKSWRLMASDDGSTWVTLDSIVDDALSISTSNKTCAYDSSSAGASTRRAKYTTSYAYYRFVIDAVKSGSQMQVSDVALYDAAGNRFIVNKDFTLSTSHSFNTGSEGYDKAVDTSSGNGKTDTKWFQDISSLGSGFYLQFNMAGQKAVPISRYSWYTANDTASKTGRNLKSWRLLGSNDGTTWTTLDVIADATSVTTANRTLAYEKTYRTKATLGSNEFNVTDGATMTLTGGIAVNGSAGISKVEGGTLVLADSFVDAVNGFTVTEGTLDASNTRFRLGNWHDSDCDAPFVVGLGGTATAVLNGGRIYCMSTGSGTYNAMQIGANEGDAGYLYATNANVTSRGRIRLATGANSYAYVDKLGGDWTVEANASYGRFLMGEGAGSRSEFYHRGGTLETWSDICLGLANATTNYFELSGGTVTQAHNNDVRIGDSGNAASRNELCVKGGTFNALSDIRVCNGAPGMLTVDGGEVNAVNGQIKVSMSSDSGESGAVALNGGVVKTRGIVHGGGVENGLLTFNGGTLQAVQSGSLVSGASLAVGATANGGMIDTAGFDVTIASDVGDATGEHGKMAFAGGGVVTVSGAALWTGGTELTNLTYLSVSSAANAANILTNGLSFALPAGGVVPGTPVLTLTGGEAIDPGWIGANDVLVGDPEDTANLYLALSQDGTTVVVKSAGSQEYVWTGSVGDEWGAADKWDGGSGLATWIGGKTAIFETPGASATLAAAATASEVVFRADATVADGGGTLTVPTVAVSNGVSGTISAATVGALEKTGPGTLTLGSSRTEETVLAEGTLVLASGASLDWSQFAFGTDPLKPVTLRVADGATLSNVSPLQIGKVADVTSTLVKEGGDWSVGGNFALGNAAGAVASLLHRGGTLTVGGYLSIGDAGDSAYLEISGGTVSSTHTGNYTIIGNWTDGAAVVTNTGVLAVTGNLLVGNNSGSSGVLTIVDGGAVNVVGETAFDYNSAEASGAVNLKAGGVLSSQRLYRRNNGSAALSFDGGILKASANNVNLIESGITVTTTANGGIIDANGKAVTIVPAISGAGGMTFKGGGKVALSSANTYTGKTVVELGTTVHVSSPANLGGGLSVSVPDAAPADGVYTLLALDGAESFTDAVIEGVAAPENSRLEILPGGKSVVCIYGDDPGPVWIGGTTGSLSDSTKWANGAVPGAGANCVIGVDSAATLTVGNLFAASSITFPADSAAVTINAAAGESIAGITAITNLSAAVQKIACRLDFAGTYRVHCTSKSVNFSGGAYATYPDASMSSDTVASHALTGEIHFTEDWTIPNQPADNPFVVAAGARVYGKKVTAASYQSYHLRIDKGAVATFTTVAIAGKLIFRLNGGNLVATGDVTLGGENKRDFGYYGDGTVNNGTVEARGIFKNVTGHGLIYQYITNMVVGASGYGMYRRDYNIMFCNNLRLTAKADLAIHKPIASDGPKNGDYGLILNGKTFTINTAGYTVTFDSYVGNGDSVTAGAVVKEGTGELVMASLEKRYSGGTTVKGGKLTVKQQTNGLGSGAVTVNSGATLALMNGVNTGAGNVTANGGATLEVAESGTATLGGNLTLQSGAILGFSFTEKEAAPLLAIASGKTVTANDTVNVKVSAVGDIRPAFGADGKYALTSGGGFSGKTVTLTADAPKWAKSVTIVDGNIVLSVKPKPMVIVVR